MKTHWILSFILFILLAFVGIEACIAQAYTIETVPNPKQTKSSRYVSNPDHILSDQAVSQINVMLGRLEDSTTAQVAVVCLNSIGDLVPKDFATELFRKWGLGYQKKNNGLLVLLVKDQHRIEMETGYGLEGILPDAVCKRIQTEQMVPALKKGDFDGAIIAGVDELQRRVSEPEAAKEVYDKSKFPENQPLEDSAIFVLFILLIPVLFVQRTINFLTKKRNPIADQVEKALSKSKMRGIRTFLLYMVLPLCLGFVVTSLRGPLNVPGWQIMVVIYSYMIFIAWEARNRRKKVFADLFGNLPEAEWYSKRMAVRLNGWDNIIFFPIPFALLKIVDDRKIDLVRNHPRRLEGFPLERLGKTYKDLFLNDNQELEEKLNTVSYDVWRNTDHNLTQTIAYENLSKSDYERCSKCDTRAMHFDSDRVVSAATKDREGRGAKVYECKACKHQRETQYSIPMIVERAVSSYSGTTYSSSGSSSSSWSSSSSSSSSSWGGGSSGGGGAGSSW